MRMPVEEFERHVLAAYAQLPPAARDALDGGNIDIIVQDYPGPEAEGAIDSHPGHPDPGHPHPGQTHPAAHHGPDHGHGSLLGLYVGVPLIDRYGAEPILPDCIYIYRQPILEVCESYDAVVEEIRITLLHEIGHYLGLGEQDLERLGYG